MVGKRGTWMGRALALALLGLGATGCSGGSDAGSEARLAALTAEGEQMDAALDAVEDRLLGNQAQLQLWAELGRRHKQVSAIHTQQSGAHLEAMVAYMDRMQEKARGLKRRRVASADTVLTSGRQRRHGGED